MVNARVDVVLATYNGAAFVDQQIESVLAQKGVEVCVWISDDGSTDDTCVRLEQWAQRQPRRIRIVPNRQQGRGAMRNFEYLMQVVLEQGDGRWVAFADQDDVWLPDKLALSAEAMLAIEHEAGTHVPCLVHTDLRVVDAQGLTIHPSMAAYEGLAPARATPVSMLSVNQVTGCTMLVNRSLLKLALPIPPQAIMHDWWCAVIAGCGRRAYAPLATVLYRQHGTNQLGARDRSALARLRRLARDASGVWHRVQSLSRATWWQAVALKNRLDERGCNSQYVADYLAWRAQARRRRLLDYRRYYAGPELDRLVRWWCWTSYQESIPPCARHVTNKGCHDRACSSNP